MPLSTITYPFPIDGEFRKVFHGRANPHWKKASENQGYSLIGCAQDRYHVVLGCHKCGQPTLKRVNVILENQPECSHCIRARREEAANAVGATLLGPDPDFDRHYGEFKLVYGHTVRRQYLRVEKAAAGGHQLSCEQCQEARHAAEADACGWQLFGKADRKNPGYRRYRHSCGHEQDVLAFNMKNGEVDCAGCGESWTSKPSRIYIFAFALPGLPVIKLGYSSNPAFRLGQVENDPGETCGEVIRDLAIKTGHDANRIEKALHKYICNNRPDLVVRSRIHRQACRRCRSRPDPEICCCD